MRFLVQNVSSWAYLRQKERYRKMAEKQGVSELDTIILSLHERWWKKMLAGEKILEIRKTAPTKKDREYRVLVYVTGGGGVCGEFICTDRKSVV